MLRNEGELGSGARYAVTDRWGGAGAAPYDELNLATHVGDDPTAVTVNRARVTAALEVTRVAWMHQVHGSDVALVQGGYEDGAIADALVTRERGVALAVLVADCTPVLVADAAAGVVGVAHAGREGMARGVVPALLAAMRDLGARQLTAVVGPSICGLCYRVPAALRDEVAAGVPEAWAVARDGTPSLAVAAGASAQLARQDVRLERLPGCSAEDGSLFSHRRAGGPTGRYAGFAWLS